MSWRKSWSIKNLDPNGTKRRLTPEQRSVWDDCLDLAETAPITGSLCVAPKVPFSTAQLAAIFHTPEDVVHASLMLFKRLGMMTDDYHISSWKKYQSEYQRQKGYRYKLHNKVTRNGDK